MLTENTYWRAHRPDRIAVKILGIVSTVPAELGRALAAAWRYERLGYGRAREEDLTPAYIPGRIFEAFYAAERKAAR
jgi:hypothetical protein